jgi:hypothetical protein
MFAYGRTITTHSCSQLQFPEMDQTWYADDAGAGGKFDAIKRHLEARRNETNAAICRA